MAPPTHIVIYRPFTYLRRTCLRYQQTPYTSIFKYLSWTVNYFIITNLFISIKLQCISQALRNFIPIPNQKHVNGHLLSESMQCICQTPNLQEEHCQILTGILESGKKTNDFKLQFQDGKYSLISSATWCLSVKTAGRKH